MKKIYLLYIALMPVLVAKSGTAIVGGESIEITTRPFQVSLQDITENQHFCGGAIIADNWVITAAHCIEDTDPASIQVLAGATVLSESNVGQVLQVEKIYSHLFVDYVNDIALLKLKGNFNFNSNVAAIPLVTQSDDNMGKLDHGNSAYVSGWGALEEDGENYPDTLMGVAVSLVDNDTAKAGDYPELIHSHLVAGKGMGKDACYGDSGGPLTIEDNGVTKLAGLVSYGQGCGSNYGIYCRVPSYENWINKLLNGEVTALFNMNKVLFTGDTIIVKDQSYNEPTEYLWSLSKKDSSTVLTSASTMNFTGVINETGWYTLALAVSNASSSDSITYNFEVLEAPKNCGTYNWFDDQNLSQIEEEGLRIFSWDYADYVGFSFPKDTNLLVIDSVCFSGEFDAQPSSGIYHTEAYFDVYQGESVSELARTASFSNLKKGKNCGSLDKPLIISGSAEVIFLMGTYMASPDGENWNDVYFDGFYVDHNNRFQSYGYADELVPYETVNGMKVLPAISLGACSNENNWTSAQELNRALNELTIYPNPATNQIRIHGNHKGHYEIISAQGALLIQGSLNGQNHINVTGLKSGVYHVQFKNLSGVHTGKFIKL